LTTFRQTDSFCVFLPVTLSMSEMTQFFDTEARSAWPGPDQEPHLPLQQGG
jgi:hypothetical protein